MMVVRLGMSPREALAAATNNYALQFGWSELGQIAPGRRADILVEDGDPTVSIWNARRISGLVLDGNVIDREKSAEPETIVAVKQDRFPSDNLVGRVTGDAFQKNSMTDSPPKTKQPGENATIEWLILISAFKLAQALRIRVDWGWYPAASPQGCGGRACKESPTTCASTRSRDWSILFWTEPPLSMTGC